MLDRDGAAPEPAVPGRTGALIRPLRLLKSWQRMSSVVGEGAMGLPIQIILLRQLAGYLSVPLYLADPKGNLLFYNEPAEALIGLRFEETGVMPADTWTSILTPIDEQGQSIPPEELPLMIALTTRRPAHKRFYIHGMNGVRRHIEVAAIPMVGLQGEFLGATSLFWEIEQCA
jgi:PAS domain-containing protein